MGRGEQNRKGGKVQVRKNDKENKEDKEAKYEIEENLNRRSPKREHVQRCVVMPLT